MDANDILLTHIPSIDSARAAMTEASTPLARALQDGSWPKAKTGDYVDSFGGIYSYEEIGRILDTSEPGERNASAIDHMALWYRMETAERALALANETIESLRAEVNGLKEERIDLRREVKHLVNDLNDTDRQRSDGTEELALADAEIARLRGNLRAEMLRHRNERDELLAASRVVAMGRVDEDKLFIVTDTGVMWKYDAGWRRWELMAPVPGTPAALAAGGTASEAAA